MLEDLRQYTINDVKYSGPTLFFYMLCQRITDTELLHNVLNALENGLDDALDVYPSTYWITRITDDAEMDDFFGLQGNYIVKMLLSCFDVSFEIDGYGMGALGAWHDNRFIVCHIEGRKRPKDNLSKRLDYFLQELDSDYLTEYKKAAKDGDLLNLSDQVNDEIYYDYQQIKLYNKCKHLEELETILDDMGYQKASRGLYFWAGYYYGYGNDDLEEYSGFCVTSRYIEKLKVLPVINDVSNYEKLFNRLQFEEGNNMLKLIRAFTSESFNSKDVIF